MGDTLMMDAQTYNRLVKVDVMTKQDLSSYKDGVFDAVVHGIRDYSNKGYEYNHYYKQGYDYGLGIVQELNIQGACFLEGEE